MPHRPQHPNGLIHHATSHKPKRRLSDDIPPFLGSYIPTFTDHERQRATSATANAETDWAWYWSLFKTYARYVIILTFHTSMSILYFIMNNIYQILASARYWRPRDLISIRLLLILLWLPLLWWGELTTFSNSVVRCDWSNWETWPTAATPHRVALVADPQLVDPHTYPGRPWPLSTLTVKYTDLYLWKSFGRIMRQLQPESVAFLGDLFDGGREWSPPDLERDARIERRWRRYGQKLWMREYRRFGRIFTDQFLAAKQSQPAEGKLLMSLPGNHDLGLGNGIRVPVRKRFYAFFGEGNRIDIVGNHSFVSIDSVSLSAKGQPDPATGVTADTESGAQIWEPTEAFLKDAVATKARVVERHLRAQKGLPMNEPLDTGVYGLDDPRAKEESLTTLVNSDIPSILLTHVPLYRAQGTPCGPLRERHPPSKHPTEDGKDEANAIHIQAGFQYQNVLTSPISNEVIDLVPDVTHVFSGDDHDYCDILHHEYTSKSGGGGIREITVKSISWAMGIRKPGFVMLSLWNPLDSNGKALHARNGGESHGKQTIQTHLCLLPDQLGIFITYAWMFVLTLIALLVRSTRAVYARPIVKGLLPMTRVSRAKEDPPLASPTFSSSTGNGLSVRSGKQRAASPAKGGGYGYAPPASEDGEREKPWQEIDLTGNGWIYGRGVRAVLGEWQRSVLLVAIPVVVWYLYLLGWGS